MLCLSLELGYAGDHPTYPVGLPLLGKEMTQDFYRGSLASRQATPRCGDAPSCRFAS
jgi:hypothetical protein